MNPTATQLPPGTYRPHVAFRNVTNGHGGTDRIATLIVQAPPNASKDGGPLLDGSEGYLLDDRGDRLRDAMRALHLDRPTPRSGNGAGRRAFQRAVGEKGPDGSLTLLAFRRARFPARPNRRFKALFPRGRYLHELYALDIALDKEALRNCRSSVRPLPLRMTGAP